MSPGRAAEPQDRPVRVRVTSSRRDAATRRDFRPLTREIDEQTDLGEVYMAGLMSAQLRLSLRVLVFGAVGLGGLPLLFLLVPDTRTLEIGSVPFPWLVLGVLVYPVALLVARYYVRQSERIEREFSQVVARR
ncbi:MAG TPA: hypothetical protein VFX53_11155 [Pedococcus sp.]|jgi:hypothetical protein|nr:hypothetical protein [Pedococcus sp.]